MTDGWGFVVSTIPTFPLWVQNGLGLLFFALLGLVIYRLACQHLGQEQWHEYHAPPWKRVIYLDGSNERGPMPCFRRRKQSGEWEYRPYKAAELEQWNKDHAI